MSSLTTASAELWLDAGLDRVRAELRHRLAELASLELSLLLDRLLTLLGRVDNAGAALALGMPPPAQRSGKRFAGLPRRFAQPTTPYPA